MIYNQKISQALGSPLRKGLVIGATSILATGALLGAGVGAATAATTHSTPPAGSTSASASQKAHGHFGGVSLTEHVRDDLFHGQISATKVHKLVERIISDQKVFSALPANLQSDLTALSKAPTNETVADAQKLKATAIAGGYGDQIKSLAVDLQNADGLPISKKLVSEIQADLTSGATAAMTGTKIAKTVSAHPELFSKLPANLQTDVTTLKDASAAAEAAQVQKIEATAATGGYGAQIQKLTQQLTSMAGTGAN